MLNIYANVSSADLPLNNSGVEFLLIDVDNDRFIFSAGSDVVKDGEPSPGDTQLNQAGILLTGGDITIDKHFVDDSSEGILRHIQNMGNKNKRYVLAFDFDEPTASEPVLELWDDDDMESVNLASLGAGTPSGSWFRGVVTTNALPGESWTGERLAGASDGHFLWLNNQSGPLSIAKTLYCQMKIIIPSTQQTAGAELPIIAVKYASTP